MSALVKLTNGIKRRFSPTLKLMVEVGYISFNENGVQRTKDGVHTLLNFLEAQYEKEFVAYLKTLREEKVADAKEDCGQ